MTNYYVQVLYLIMLLIFLVELRKLITSYQQTIIPKMVFLKAPNL